MQNYDGLTELHAVMQPRTNARGGRGAFIGVYGRDANHGAVVCWEIDCLDRHDAESQLAEHGLERAERWGTHDYEGSLSADVRIIAAN